MTEGLNKETEMLIEKAISIASAAHYGARDRYGAPYILHVLRVGMAGKTAEEMIAGFLHDLVEDTDWTLQKLQAEGFPKHIVSAVDCLSKRDGESYNDFVIRSASDPLARAVKQNDLKDNLNMLRVKGSLTKDDLTRLNKYLKALRDLGESN